MNELHLTGEQVRVTRDALAMSQAAFADAAGCSQHTISIYERKGLPARMNKRTRLELLKLASEQGVIPTAEHEGDAPKED